MVIMKAYSFIPIAVLIIMLLTPFAAFLGRGAGSNEEKSTAENISAADVFARNDTNEISVFNPSDESVTKMSMRDYCVGVVAAEMPASYEPEALKAQALAAITYAQYVKDNSDSGSKGDIAADSSVNQGYLTVDEMKERWGDSFDEYYEKICNAVDAVANYRIYYDSKPINALYHAISSGKTEDAAVLWGSDIPYLKSEDSGDDKLSPRYSVSTAFTPEQFKERCAAVDGVKLPENEADWVENIKKSDAGTVVGVEIGGVSLSGTRVREIFSLRSPSFDIDYENGLFTFKTYGYGHGVGMSQYGANRMAEDGAKYNEIIAHYYKGVSIVNVVNN